MTIPNFHKAIFSLLLLLACKTGLAQSVQAGATVDRKSILIGEPIRLTLTADIPETEQIRFFTIDTLPHFEILDRPKIDTSNTSGGTILKQVLVITSFDSGHWVIPALSLGPRLLTDSIPVDVAFTDFDTTRPYHDIAEILDVDLKDEDPYWWMWYAIGGAVLLLVLLLVVFTRKKKPAPVPQAVPVDAWAEAMRALEKLRASKPAQKQYYAELVDIFRLYVHRKKGIRSLQKTTDDLVLQLRELKMPGTIFDQLAQTLRLTDFVKFAKYNPEKEEAERSFEAVLAAIRQIEETKDAV